MEKYLYTINLNYFPFKIKDYLNETEKIILTILY